MMGKLHYMELNAFYFHQMFKLYNDNCISLYLTCITEIHCAKQTSQTSHLNIHKERMSLQLTSSAQKANEPNELAHLVQG